MPLRLTWQKSKTKIMKKINLRLMILILSGLFILNSGYLTAQESVKKETREVGPFTGIDVGGAFEVFLGQDKEGFCRNKPC